MHVDRDTTAVVLNGHAAIFVNHDIDRAASAGQRLVDGVINHLVYQVVKRFNVGAADVHSRSTANSLQALKDLNVLGAVAADLFSFLADVL